MKLKNILPILSFLFVAVACSMDSDILNDLSNEAGEGKGTVTTELGEAAIAFNVNLPGMTTKASTITDGGTQAANDAEAAINNCTLVLLEGNTVVKVVDDLQIKDGVVVHTAAANDTVKYVVKAKNNAYRFMVIANSSKKFATYSTLASIQDVVQGSDDLATFVKVGTSDFITIPNNKMYTSTTDPEMLADPIFADVTLTQLTARIELAEFSVTGYTDPNGNGASGLVPQDVKLNSLVISNVNQVSYTDKNTHLGQDNCYTNITKTYANDGLLVHAASDNTFKGYVFGEDGNEAAPVYYSFRNINSGKALTVTLNYTVGDEARTKTFTINNGEIKAGYLYRLFITSDIKNDNMECSLKCYTLDWKPNAYEVTIIK